MTRLTLAAAAALLALTACGADGPPTAPVATPPATVPTEAML